MPSSPRVWGCFLAAPLPCRRARVFPTRVGVFPGHPWSGCPARCLPHACGGVSPGESWICWIARSSPRVWGCFLSSASQTGRWWSSPRVWGCFRKRNGAGGRGGVFPTRVGVFPRRNHEQRNQRSLPHACGGVSVVHEPNGSVVLSSPRVWGCFYGGFS